MQTKVIVETPKEAFNLILSHDFYIIKVKIIGSSYSEWIQAKKEDVSHNGSVLYISNTRFPFELIEELKIRYFCGETLRETLSVKVSINFLYKHFSKESKQIIARFINIDAQKLD